MSALLAAALAVVLLNVPAVANHGGTTHVMTVIISGSGSVASSPAGIACPPDCTETYTNATMVNLTATPLAGASFTSWQGSVCTGQSPANPCVGIPMINTRLITATFSGTTPPPPTGVRVVGAGDISTSNASDTTTSNLVLALNPDKVLTFGDNVYPDGTAGQFSSFYAPTWGRFKSITQPAPGNHDHHTAGAAGYEGYFGVQSGQARSFVVGDWLLVSMDSEVNIAAQRDQLNAILAADDHLCEAIYYHHARYSSGEHGSNTRTEPWWVVGAAHGLDLVLTGHDHNYERFAPNRGIREFVVGTGGVNTRAFKATIAGSEKRLTGNANWGVIDLQLSSGAYAWEFRRATGGTGTIADSGSGTCH